MFTLIFATCNKPQDTVPDPNSFYFRCKINGQTYIPNSCANCITCSILGDTTFLLGGNAGFEAVFIGVINTTGVQIISTAYVLNDNPRYGATYKNSTTTNDRFDTDATRTGQLVITSLDKSNRIVTGTFYFQAYNPVQNKTVDVTEGIFRLRYTTN